MAEPREVRDEELHALADFRYQLRAFLRASEELCKAEATARQFLEENGSQISNTLQTKVKYLDLLVNRLDKMVFVRADSRAKYEKVVGVVDNLRAAGVDQLGLLTDKIEEKGKGNLATPEPGK